MDIFTCCLIIVLAPLAGSIIAGIFRKQVGKTGAHSVTIFLVAVSFVLSSYVAFMILSGKALPININLYTWLDGGAIFPFKFNLGFLIDELTAIMLVVVTFVSLLVHIYSIGYMSDDDGYQRFFSYVSLFTFMMLMLVTSNNFLQLFFGWEGVGLVSYLLIGFWYQKESAIQGSLKAFLVNRVGDFGFILGIALVFMYAGTVDYADFFQRIPGFKDDTITIFAGHSWSLVTVMSLLLFVGAMGKSAQVPLHVWLPESMEGPTPISALIHAATMVTAGVFMVARISPLIEYSNTALSTVLVIGATGALFTGLLAIVMNDIKRVIAYSTLSQLGYMMVAMGVSAYSAGMFHLVTHAAFKALLFLGAGSVIIGMHHEQDMRKMGGLYKKMPITYITFLIGALALVALPPFAGFFSKDTIIEVAKLSTIKGSTYAYICVLLGAFVTAVYTFRQLFMTFHGKPRMSAEEFNHVHESPWVVWLPLVLLAIPSVILGYIMYMPILFDKPSLLGNSIFILPQHNVLLELGHEVTSAWHSIVHSLTSPVLWLTISGILIAYVSYIVKPTLPEKISKTFPRIYKILLDKYGIDKFNDLVFIRGTRAMGQLFYKLGDQKIIDGLVVNGTARIINFSAFKARLLQSGYLYQYTAVMMLGLIGFLCWFLLRT